MKRMFAILILSIAFCSNVLAQQNPGDVPATKEDVQKYLEVTHSKEMMTKVIDAMAAPMHQIMHQQYLKNKDKLPPDFEVRMFKSFPWSEMLDAMVPVYQTHFTKNDINFCGLLSDAGRSEIVERDAPDHRGSDAGHDATPPKEHGFDEAAYGGGGHRNEKGLAVKERKPISRKEQLNISGFLPMKLPAASSAGGKFP